MTFGKFIIAGNQTGNPEDLPTRTLVAIKTATHIFCDHFRVFKKDILDFYQIDISDKNIKETGQIYNEILIAEEAISILKDGKDVLFITDSGLPGFADKGMKVTDKIYAEGFEVQIIPGPTIAGLAIAVAGLPSSAEQTYCISLFDYTQKEKHKILSSVKDFECTIVVLCHPEEVKNNLELGAEIFGLGRWAAVCKNISMPSQEIFRGQLKDLTQQNISPKECYTTLVFQGK
jgi:16S rRNA (cytidine1402-2'-O)-methyltransferase